ncbi:hypothetical protein [Stenotrophomonas sp.]|uniref:hypothetical protein n=1 Tax=Stenotrophomonas sp. TaxID=69392 RepID=UPI00289B3FB8|nr:hypothetical protein [Stenotrophomonas sp.]
MIKDVPERSDFDGIGNALLNQAWGDLISLLANLEAAKNWLAESGDEEGADEADEEAYWASAATKLSTALAIAHQAAEFYIKGRIVEVSPFLLLANGVRDWPRADSDGHTSFSKLRTVDAQDLVRLHDRCASAPMGDAFKRQLEDLRVQRNAIMHTVNKEIVLSSNDLIRTILGIHRNLVGGSWLAFRRSSLENSGDRKLYSDAEGWLEENLIEEFQVVQPMLSVAEVQAVFELPAGQRRYFCPNCSWDTFDGHGQMVCSATLRPNVPDGATVWCPLCDKAQPVERRDCQKMECLGNVITFEWDRCLTCGGRQEHCED